MLVEYSLIIMGLLTKGYKKEENGLDKGWNIFQGEKQERKREKHQLKSGEGDLALDT